MPWRGSAWLCVQRCFQEREAVGEGSGDPMQELRTWGIFQAEDGNRELAIYRRTGFSVTSVIGMLVVMFMRRLMMYVNRVKGCGKWIGRYRPAYCRIGVAVMLVKVCPLGQIGQK